MSYEEFEEQWMGMLKKFSNWQFGMPQEDLEQELRVVMWQAKENWSPTKGASMSTYLWNAMWNKTNKLRCSLNFTKSRVPPGNYVSIEDHLSLTRPDAMSDELDLLKGVGEEGALLAREIMLGYDKPQQWKQRGLTKDQIKSGRAQIAFALGG
jgi:hypothetical protein